MEHAEPEDASASAQNLALQTECETKLDLHSSEEQQTQQMANKTFSTNLEVTNESDAYTNESDAYMNESVEPEMALVAAVVCQQPLVGAKPDDDDNAQVHDAPTTPSQTEEHTALMPSNKCEAQQQQELLLQQQRIKFEQKMEQLSAALLQKDNMIALYERENSLLEKEKQAFRKEKELANKEKEATVIKFAMKEKLLLDAKKEKDLVEKQLADARKEVKNVTARFHAVNEEKSRITYIIDEKFNEVRKYQRECEKLKTDYGHLESKLKYHMNKLNIETEAKLALEKKLEEERNAPNRLEEKALEKIKVEHEANTILLRHEIEHKTDQIEILSRENKKSTELVKELRDQLSQLTNEKNDAIKDFEALQNEHTSVQNALSDEILNSAKLRGQLDELQVLRTQNALNEEKICSLNEKIQKLEETIEYNAHDIQELRTKELELLTTNKEVSESLVNLQNEMCLLKARLQGTIAENELLKKERVDYELKYKELEQQLQKEIELKSEERQLLTKHLSEKTKLYETTKLKLENLLGDFEATNHKHANVVKELQREIQKYKKLTEHGSTQLYNERSQNAVAAAGCLNEKSSAQRHNDAFVDDSESSTTTTHSRPLSRNSSSNRSINGRAVSETTSDAETTLVATTTVATSNKNAPSSSVAGTLADGIKGPSKKHLVERILRLQQAAARQTEKIDFLENHNLQLVAELQKKAKVVHYYMLRDQAGALTSTKSDQHKSELSKYGNGVMSAIYGGIKAENKSMTLDLSLEINKKLQAVLEDTLLKNITLKENLDVLGLEVDNLTRKLRYIEAKEKV